MTDEYIANPIFGKIEADERVNPDLDYCIYCQIYDSKIDKLINYKIILNCIKGNKVKQCPACKRIYILSDIFD